MTIADLDSENIENESFQNLEFENQTLLTNIGDCSITIGNAILSCLVIMALKSIYITFSIFSNIKSMYEGGEDKNTKVSGSSFMSTG
jgi:hypothetical protein